MIKCSLSYLVALRVAVSASCVQWVTLASNEEDDEEDLAPKVSDGDEGLSVLKANLKRN